MGAEIDRLEVQVEAQATKANNQLDKLAMKLDRVSKALSGLNSHGLSGLADSVSKFAQASTQLSNVKTADFTRLTKNIGKLSALNTQQIYGASSAMHTLATAMNSLGNSSKNSTQVTQLASAISHIFRKTFASSEYQRTKNVKYVSILLGHSSTAVTEKFYLVDDLREIVYMALGAA